MNFFATFPIWQVLGWLVAAAILVHVLITLGFFVLSLFIPSSKKVGTTVGTTARENGSKSV